MANVENLSQLALDNSYKTVIERKKNSSYIFNGLESWKTDEYVESLYIIISVLP